jgi:hypothetical protein
VHVVGQLYFSTIVVAANYFAVACRVEDMPGEETAAFFIDIY